jgi:hypothetical protein
LINELSGDDSDENESSDEKKPSAFAKIGGLANIMQNLTQKFAPVKQLDSR